MTHEAFSRDEAPQGGSDRSFGLVFSAFFAVLAALDAYSKLPFSLNPARLAQCPWLSAHAEWSAHLLSFAFIAASLLFLIFALLLPKALSPLNKVWTAFGLLLHKIVSPIVLGALFFAVFTPTGVLMRLFGGDPLRLRFEPGAASYWIDRVPPGPTPDSLKDQF